MEGEEVFIFRIYHQPLSHLNLESKRWDPRLTKEQNVHFQMELSREELARLVPVLAGRPTFYEHMDNHPSYEPLPLLRDYGIRRESWGYIVKAEQNPQCGSVYVYVRPFDTLAGRSMATKLKKPRGAIKGCSLQHTRDMVENRVWANEVSSCEEGKRPQTFFLGTTILKAPELFLEEPTPTCSSTITDLNLKADLSDLPYVHSGSPEFRHLLPPGQTFRNLSDFYGNNNFQGGNFSLRSAGSVCESKRGTPPGHLFSRASRGNPTERGGSGSHFCLPNHQTPDLDKHLGLLLSGTFTLQRSGHMSVTSKASIMQPSGSSSPPKDPLIATQTTKQVSFSRASAMDIDNNSGVHGAAPPQASSLDPTVGTDSPAQAPSERTEPQNAPSDDTLPVQASAASEEKPQAPCAKESPEALREERPFYSEQNMKAMGVEAWNNLNEIQRGQVQGMLDALRLRHSQASSKLQQQIRERDQEILKWRAAKEAQEKKSLDDFMSRVLKVVSQTTDAQTQACLQDALAQIPASATIAEKASAFLPFVAHAELMTSGHGAKIKTNLNSKNSLQPSSKASKKPFAKAAPSAPHFSLEVTPASNPKPHDSDVQKRLNSRSSARSGEGEAEGLPSKRQKMSSGSSLGFVFNSVLNENKKSFRQGRFVFE